MSKFSNILKYLLCGWLLLFTNSFLFAQNSAFTYQHFGIKEGLSSNNIHCLYKDSRGLLWIGTEDMGLCFYDGVNFQSYSLSTPQNRSIPFNGRVNAICEDALGRLWVATNVGIYIVSLNERTVFLFSPCKDNSFKSTDILAFLRTHDENIWVTTAEDKIAIIDSELNVRWIQVNNVNGVEQIIEDSAGNVWLTNFEDDGVIFKIDTNGTILSND